MVNDLLKGIPNVSIFDLPRDDMVAALKSRLAKYAANESRSYDIDVEASLDAMLKAIDKYHEGNSKFVDLELILKDGRRRSVVMV